MSEDGPARWSASQALAWIIRQKPLRLEVREWTPDMGPGIEDARAKLASAIANGEVHAWGRREPHGLTEKIPSDPFRISGVPVVVEEYGEMVTAKPYQQYKGPRWHSIEFEPNEIKQAFPKPPSLPAVQWMRQEAERHAADGHVQRRDIMVEDCMIETGCTKREAEAAHKMLPENLKRKQGRPPRAAG